MASCLTSGDEKTVQNALSILAAIENDCPPQDRWRVTLAIRQGADQAQLVKLTAHNEERIADLATGLLKRVALLTSAATITP